MKYFDGIAVIFLGLLYGWGGLLIEESKVGIQDRVGPGFFPVGVAILIILCGIFMVFRKDGVDHSQVWPPRRFWKIFTLLVGILIFYGLVFDTLGFLVANTLLCFYLGVLLKARISLSLLSGLMISLSIFILFSIILEISLSYGWLSFIEDWLYEY